MQTRRRRNAGDERRIKENVVNWSGYSWQSGGWWWRAAGISGREQHRPRGRAKSFQQQLEGKINMASEARVVRLGSASEGWHLVGSASIPAAPLFPFDTWCFVLPLTAIPSVYYKPQTDTTPFPNDMDNLINWAGFASQLGAAIYHHYVALSPHSSGRPPPRYLRVLFPEPKFNSSTPRNLRLSPLFI